MNLEDVIDPEYGLQQDEWSLSRPTFGSEGQLSVVGWSGRYKVSSDKYARVFTYKKYVIECALCKLDTELHGSGVFSSLKNSLVAGQVPCGCTKSPRWSKEQYSVLCARKATELGYTFLGFVGEWEGRTTKIKMFCEKHGQWSSGAVGNLINIRQGCPGCGVDAARTANTKPDDVMIQSFFDSGAFHPGTKFWRSDRVNSRNLRPFWFTECPVCGSVAESVGRSLQTGSRPCACTSQRQQECYINWLIDSNNMAVAIKFGIANSSKRRIKEQSSTCAYTLKQHAVYTFPSVQQCKQAERECKKELETGVVLKRDMPDGWTETTWAYNIGKVKSIYERNGGVLV